MRRPKSVLVVEDEVLIAMDIQAELEDAGWTVIGPAGTVAQAMKLLEGHTPSVAVLDINLGGSPSFPIADALEARSIPFVFLSGNALTGEGERFSHRRLFSKPVQYSVLLNGLEDCL